MKYTTATIALLAGLAAAHESPFGDSVPHCAIDCIMAGIEAIGCTVEDTACACTAEKQTELTTNPELVSCMTSSCTGEELADAIAGGAALCAGGDATGSDGAPAPTESGDSSSSGSAPAPTGAGNSTTTASSGSDGAGSPKPTGGSGAGGDDKDGDDKGGDDQGSDDADGDDADDDSPSSAAIPAVFGGAAILAAILAL